MRNEWGNEERFNHNNGLKEQNGIYDSKKKFGNRVRYTYVGLIVLVSLVCLLVVYLVFIRTKNDAGEVLETQAPVTQAPTPEPTKTQSPTPAPTPEPNLLERLGAAIPEKEIDWEGLKKKNEDVYAWIYVPGTKIDYPVAQHPTDNEFYLEHNLNKSKGYPGVIMTQNYNTKTFKDFNTVIYGHNMKNKTGFGSLHYYEGDKKMFDEHPFVYIYTQDKSYVYYIYAEYIYSNELITYSNDFYTVKGIDDYLKKVEDSKNSDKDNLFRDNVKISAKNHIVTLSTCTSPSNEQLRFLVQAVLLNDETLSKEELANTINIE